jgi:hypothetical protein
MELAQEIYEKAASPNQELDILITLSDSLALEEFRNAKEIQVKKVFKFINTVLVRMKVKHILALSRNPAVRNIELDQEVSL